MTVKWILASLAKVAAVPAVFAGALALLAASTETSATPSAFQVWSGPQGGTHPNATFSSYMYGVTKGTLGATCAAGAWCAKANGVKLIHEHNRRDLTALQKTRSDAYFEATNAWAAGRRFATTTNVYNCHGYSMFGSGCMVDAFPNGVHQIKLNEEYELKTSFKTGDVVKFPGNHSGVVVGVKLGTCETSTSDATKVRVRHKNGHFGGYTNTLSDIPGGPGAPWRKK